MHRTKKLTVVTTAAALLMGAAGVSSAVADHKADHYKVTICHATGEANPPYNRIHVSKNAEEAHDHHQHNGDLLLGRDDSNTKQCPTTPVPPGEDNKLTICHLLPGGAYDRIHVSENSDEHNAHKGHGSDIVSRDHDDDDDCPPPDGDGDETCSVSGSSGSSTTNQAGLVNIAALNGNAGSLLPNLACGAGIVADLNVLGFAPGGPSLGGSLLGSELLGGTAGILTGAPGFLLSGLTADVRVLADVLVLL